MIDTREYQRAVDAGHKTEPMSTTSDISRPVSSEAFGQFTEIFDRQDQYGLNKYGTLLHTFNSRDPYVDGMEELTDLSKYLTQLSMERDILARFIHELYCLGILDSHYVDQTLLEYVMAHSNIDDS